MILKLVSSLLWRFHERFQIGLGNTVNSITVPESVYTRTSVQIIQSPPKPPVLRTITTIDTGHMTERETETPGYVRDAIRAAVRQEER